MKKIMKDVWTWSVLSTEKGYHFNGFLVQCGQEKVLVDPVRPDDDGLEFLKQQLPVKAIYLTNKDHERFSYELRKILGLPIFIHYRDAAYLKEKPDGTFREGESLACGMEVIHLPDQKSPGESAFYLAEEGILILGDALIGVPAGKLSMLPPGKYADPAKAWAGLQRLRALTFDMLLLGDGEPVLSRPHDLMEQFFVESVITRHGKP